MLKADYVDGPVSVHLGDALEVLRQMPSESVHCVVTSPPYWGLRDYGTGQWEGGDVGCDHGSVRRGYAETDKQATQAGSSRDPVRSDCRKCGARRVDSQLGLEPTPEEYVAKLVEIFREVRRVLRRDGTVWCNLGDSYASGFTGRNDADRETPGGRGGSFRGGERRQLDISTGLKPKDLVGIPWRLAFALQADGWWLRSDIVWSKPNPMPESVSDRPTKSHEYLFLLTKSARYFYDAEAVREKTAWPNGPNAPDKIASPYGQGFTRRNTFARNGVVADHVLPGQDAAQHRADRKDYVDPAGRNLRSVWQIATQPYPEAHFATFPEDLVIPCIKAGTSERGVCPECGAPWERVVELVGGLTTGRTAAQALDGAAKGIFHSRYRSAIDQVMAESRTTGWQPTCRHDAQPVSATVLDPFAGSGTTLAVARRLGRRAIGIELQADYLPLIRKRVEEAALPLLDAVQPELNGHGPKQLSLVEEIDA